MDIKSFFITLNILIIGTIFGQCPNQVSNLSGTSIINNIEVSVTSSGIIDSNTTSCESANPYCIGNNNAGEIGSGSYTFNFSPAINSASLNFAGISYSEFWGAVEEVQLTVNGLHYAIPSPGDLNGCEPLAVLTAEGNIRGCPECTLSGWQGTVINGPIYSLTVKNEVFSGHPNGSSFSLYICDSDLENVEFISQKITFSPNPFSNQAKLQTNINLNNSTVILYNLFGQTVGQISNVSGTSIIIERGSLESGIYILKAIRDGEILLNQKVIIKD